MTHYRLPDGTIVAAKGPRAAARLIAEGAMVHVDHPRKPRRKPQPAEVMVHVDHQEAPETEAGDE